VRACSSEIVTMNNAIYRKSTNIIRTECYAGWICAHKWLFTGFVRDGDECATLYHYAFAILCPATSHERGFDVKSSFASAVAHRIFQLELHTDLAAVIVPSFMVSELRGTPAPPLAGSKVSPCL
jgi:hypothetical protein